MRKKLKTIKGNKVGVLLLLVIFWWMGGSSGQVGVLLGAEKRQAKVTAVSGQVTVQLAGGEKTNKVLKGMSFKGGDTLVTGSDGKVTLTLDRDKTLTISQNTIVNIGKLAGAIDQGQTTLTTPSGELTLDIKDKLKGNSRFEIQTPTAVMGVRGTLFDVKVDAQGSRASVFSGLVAMANQTPAAPPQGQNNFRGQELLIYPDQAGRAQAQQAGDQEGGIAGSGLALEGLDLFDLSASGLAAVLEAMTKDPQQPQDPQIMDNLRDAQQRLAIEEETRQANQVREEVQQKGDVAGESQIKQSYEQPILPPSTGGGGSSDSGADQNPVANARVSFQLRGPQSSPQLCDKSVLLIEDANMGAVQLRIGVLGGRSLVNEDKILEDSRSEPISDSLACPGDGHPQRVPGTTLEAFMEPSTGKMYVALPLRLAVNQGELFGSYQLAVRGSNGVWVEANLGSDAEIKPVAKTTAQDNTVKYFSTVESALADTEGGVNVAQVEMTGQADGLITTADGTGSIPIKAGQSLGVRGNLRLEVPLVGGEGPDTFSQVIFEQGTVLTGLSLAENFYGEGRKWSIEDMNGALVSQGLAFVWKTAISSGGGTVSGWQQVGGSTI